MFSCDSLAVTVAVVTNGYNSNSKQFLKSQKDLNAIQKSLY